MAESREQGPTQRAENQTSAPNSLSRVLESQTPISRRTALKFLGGAALAGIASRIPGAQHVGAEAHTTNTQEGNAEPEPTQPPEQNERFKYVKDVQPTTFGWSESLADPNRFIPISGFEVSPFRDEFRGLKPEQPYDRADYIFVKLATALNKNRDEIYNLPPTFLDPNLSAASKADERASQQKLPLHGKVSEFAEELAKKDGSGNPIPIRIPIWAYTDASASGADFTLQEFDPRLGWEIRMIDKDEMRVPLIGPNDDPYTGMTQKVVDGKLVLGLYIKDFDRTKLWASEPYYSTNMYEDVRAALTLTLAHENLMMFFGRYDLQANYLGSYDANSFHYPDVFELATGPMTKEGSKIYTAPLLHVQSPTLDPLASRLQTTS